MNIPKLNNLVADFMKCCRAFDRNYTEQMIFKLKDNPEAQIMLENMLKNQRDSIGAFAAALKQMAEFLSSIEAVYIVMQSLEPVLEALIASKEVDGDRVTVASEPLNCLEELFNFKSRRPSEAAETLEP